MNRQGPLCGDRVPAPSSRCRIRPGPSFPEVPRAGSGLRRRDHQVFADEDQARVGDAVRILDGGDRDAVLRGDTGQRLSLHDHVDPRGRGRRWGGRGRRGGGPRRDRGPGCGGTPPAGRRRGRWSRGRTGRRRRAVRRGTATGRPDPVSDRRACQVRRTGDNNDRDQDSDGTCPASRSPGRSGPWSTGLAGIADVVGSAGVTGTVAPCPCPPRDDRGCHGRCRVRASGCNRPSACGTLPTAAARRGSACRPLPRWSAHAPGPRR